MAQSNGSMIAAAADGEITSAISGVAADPAPPPPNPPFDTPASATAGIATAQNQGSGTTSNSVGFDAGGLDQLRVLHQLPVDHRLELGEAQRQRIGAELPDAAVDLGRAHQIVDLLVQALDDGARRLGG